MDSLGLWSVVTAALAAAAGYPAAPVASVHISDQDISSVSYSTAVSTYTIGNDGKVKDQTGSILESWLLTGSASSFEVRVTVQSGRSLSGDAAGSWLGCGTSRQWSISNFAHDNSVIVSVFLAEIRDAGTQTVLTSATISLSAESDSFH